MSRKRLPKPPRTKDKIHPIEVKKPDQQVWREALRLADNEIGRIEIVTEETVIVHNNEEWKK